MADKSNILNIGWAGLGAMGLGMSSHLIKRGHNVTGFDVWTPSLEKFKGNGGDTATSPRAAAENKDFFVCMVANSSQAESVLFDTTSGAVQSLAQNATLLMCSTVPAAFLMNISVALEKMGRADVLLVDAPVSGGTVRAADGTLTILASATKEALKTSERILAEMSEKLFIIPGGIGAASNVKMINQLLAGAHIAAAAEAMGMAARMGLNTKDVYNIIIGAAGNSWMFENRVPHMLDGDFTKVYSALDIFVKDMGIVTSSARSHGFPLPLASAAEQLYLNASAQGYGREDDSGLVRIYNPKSPEAVATQSKILSSGEEPTPAVTPQEISKIGFVGLGAMGVGMAKVLVNNGFAVAGYDVYQPSIERFVEVGGKATAAESPAQAAKDAQILILMVQNAKQAEDVLFGSGRAYDNLPDGAVVILNSTVAPSFVKALRERLASGDRDIELIDAPVSGGVARAASGQLTIIASAERSAINKASPVLAAMSGLPKNLHMIAGGCGAASSVKLVNQHLAGIHIAVAAEAMAFAAKLGLDTRALYDIISNAAGNSWMYENRVPAMLNADWTPHSALAIFVKDLGIVLDEAKKLTYSAPLAASAHQLYLMGAGHGWMNEADGGVVRVWELMSGVSVANSASTLQSTRAPFTPHDYPSLPMEETLHNLPTVYKGNVISSIQASLKDENTPLLIILDDDPTGTQTCHGLPVLTVWDHETLSREFRTTENGFFVLTNSRALPPTEAKQLIATICENVDKAAKETTSKTYSIVLRGDSTLRGHFPQEPETVELATGKADNWILAPFFYQGGRYTIDDVHYVAEGDVLVPAAKTPFAADATFGYRSSSLRDYVLEKAGERFTSDDLYSITLEDIRKGGPSGVMEKLLLAPLGAVIIVNAAAESDMYVFAAGVLKAEQTGKKYLYRTGAAFVNCRLGIQGIPPLTAHDLDMDYASKKTGGLIVAGSYVPKTTAQLASLRKKRGDKLHVVELDVASMIHSQAQAIQAVNAAIATAEERITAGEDVLIMTSRKLITGTDAISSLNIGSVVAAALVRVVAEIKVRPRYIIAKGGITSSDAATKGLKMKRAMIVGQAAPGVPLWRCDEETSRFAGVPYVVFPGNVGGEDALAEVVERWAI